MNIATQIRQLWRTSPGFCTLVPVEGIFAGKSIHTTLPYGIVHETDFDRTFLTNRGNLARIWKARLELHVSNMEAANTLCEEAEDLFCVANHFSVVSTSVECLDFDHWVVTLEMYYRVPA